MRRFRSIRDYESFVYAIRQFFPSVTSSNLLIAHRGRRTGILRGQLVFEDGYRLVIQERLSFDHVTVTIESYGYEIWHHSEKVAWYDSQPHPNIPELSENHPHHKHIPPNIKRNRIPAPHISFTQPNLPILIQEIEALIKEKSRHG